MSIITSDRWPTDITSEPTYVERRNFLATGEGGGDTLVRACNKFVTIAALTFIPRIDRAALRFL